MAEPESDSDKTREQLLAELQHLRRRLAEFDATAAGERRSRENQVSRQFIEHVQQQSSAAIFTIDMEGRIRRANEGVATITGYDLAELVDTHHSLIFNLKAHPQTSERFLDVSVHGEILEAHETEIVHKSGDTRTIRLSAAPIFEDGNITGIVGAVEDVTEKQRAEEALRNGEAKYRKLVETVPAILLVLNPDGEIVDMNSEAEILYGCARKEGLGRNYIHDFLPPEARGGVSKDLLKVLAGEPTRNYENPVMAADGSERIISWNVDRLLNEQGDTVGVVAIGRDVTDRRRAEELLKQSQLETQLERDNLKNIIDSMGDGVYIVNADYDIEYINPVIEKIFGPAEGRKCYEYFHDRTEPCPWCKNSEVFAGKSVTWEWTSPKTGQTFELFDAPFRHVDGRISKIEFFHDITDRKEAEDALRKNRDRFSTIFRQAPLGIALIDSFTGQIYEVNPRFAEIAGRSVEKMISIDWMSITHPDDVQEDMDNMALLNAGKIPGFQMDKRYIRPDGSYVWIRMTIAPLKSEKQESPRHLAMIDDITERKQIETMLMDSESQLKEAQKIARMGRWELDIVANKLYWTDTIYEIFEIDRERFGASYEAFLAAVHPDDRDAVNKAYTDSLQDKKPYRIEHRLLMPDGRIKWVLEQCRTDYDEQGNVLRSVGIVQDITERKQVELALQESEARYRAVVQDQTEVISRFLPDGTFIFASDVFCRFFQTNEKDVLGGTWKMVALDEDAAMVEKKLAQIDPANPIITIENRVKLPDGTVHWMEFVNRGFFDENGALTEIQSVGRDITERKLAEQELEKARSELQEFFDLVPDMVCIASADDGTFKQVNRVWEQVLGYRADELIGKLFVELMHPDDIERTLAEVNRLLSGKVTSGFINRYRCKDGSYKYLEWVATPAKAMAQEKWLYAAARDVSERIRMESELSDKMQQLERFNEFAVGRELEMIRLKGEVNSLLQEIGRQKRYSAPDEIRRSEAGWGNPEDKGDSNP